MKKNNLSLVFLGLVIAIFFTLFACRKSIEGSLYPSDLIKSSVTERQDLDFALTTPDVYLEQGMLCFKDSATLNAVWTSLKKLSKDSTFNKNYRTQMGILSPNSPQDDAFPYEPAYHAFGQRFSGFTSLYKFQEDEEYNFLENGGSFEGIPEPDMDDEELTSILNANKEVKVGKLIYKYLNENQFFVITSNDFSRIPVLRALSNPLAEKRMKNTALIDSRIVEDIALYKKIVESSKIGEDCEASIAITKIGEYTYKATNTSMLDECEQTNIVWRVTDGNNNFLYSISQVDEITYTLPLNVVLPVYVSINVHAECCHVFAKEIMAGGSCSEYDGISMGLLGPITTKGTEYSFQVNGLSGITDYTVTWDFGDNSSVLSSTTNTINHTYDFDGGQKDYTVTCTISWGIACTKTISLTFNAGCGVRASNKANPVFADPPLNGNYRIKAKVKVDNRYGEFIESKLIFYRKKSNGNWKKSTAEHLWIMYAHPSNPAVRTTYLESCQERTASTSGNDEPNSKKVTDRIETNTRISTKKGLTKVTFIAEHLGVRCPPLDLYIIEP